MNYKEQGIYSYAHITQTRCGKCKHLKTNPVASYPYKCEKQGEALPEIVVDFFGDNCKDFEIKMCV